MSQILSSQGKNAPSNPYPHYLVRLATSRLGFSRKPYSLGVATPAEPRGEKKLFFVQILGGEKLLKFGEKWAVKNF